MMLDAGRRRTQSALVLFCDLHHLYSPVSVVAFERSTLDAGCRRRANPSYQVASTWKGMTNEKSASSMARLAPTGISLANTRFEFEGRWMQVAEEERILPVAMYVNRRPLYFSQAGSSLSLFCSLAHQPYGWIKLQSSAFNTCSRVWGQGCKFGG